MKALVYLGPGMLNLRDCPKPTIRAPTDAIVKITRTTICGTDLHILKGDVATCQAGRILGHEGVGVIESVGQVTPAEIGADFVHHGLWSCRSCRRPLALSCAVRIRRVPWISVLAG
jgi:alcohol dehydrogenase